MFFQLNIYMFVQLLMQEDGLVGNKTTNMPMPREEFYGIRDR